MRNKIKNAGFKVYRKILFPTNYLKEMMVQRKGNILVYYFENKKNVGDLIGPYILEKLYQRPVHNCDTRIPSHILSVGSILHEAKSQSIVWGSGMLSEQYISPNLDTSKIFALRGKYTRKALEWKFDVSLAHIPLGDPAVLMTRFYNPKRNKKFKVGVIPHYSDYQKLKNWLKLDGDVRVLDVQTEPEEFVDALIECEYILSSSLHGLILADCYNIPNKWISFVGDSLLGGAFKFLDYYSTTDNHSQEPIKVASTNDLHKVIENIESIATIKEINVDAEKLLRALPEM